MIHQPALQARLDIWPNDLWKQCFTTIGMEVFVCFPHFQVRPVGAPLSRHFIPFLIRNQFIHLGYLLGFRTEAWTGSACLPERSPWKGRERSKHIETLYVDRPQ